ncbi:hypothetical protein COCCADRAFT_95369 [Bipolaris zeicola 26-R-13]|uniref:Uncharacterized protein n=1 Tax=Cochliobolus carbonum (strain 26-R-13) TaxID=930089 RepID=W6Y1T1_COCC2|nr:uncharacterized protein COCCADRAFT_95369 [Bipolaris zeicola 26-R-13]EUC33677.1 hypothetical protein COCCADRAFT_95369 [Bipolaris zeicola 26-R-13]
MHRLSLDQDYDWYARGLGDRIIRATRCYYDANRLSVPNGAATASPVTTAKDPCMNIFTARHHQTRMYDADSRCASIFLSQAIVTRLARAQARRKE